MAHHREREQRARRLRLSRDGELRHAGAAAGLRPARRSRRRLCASPRSAPRTPSGWLAALVLILALLGAGSKAGLVPLHVWLPLAHPAAPSHVSALMSGVMTKVAVYGFIRIVFDLLGPPAWWWSMRGARARRRHRGAGRALRADAARPEAAARLSARSRISASSSSASVWRWPSRPTAWRRPRRWRFTAALFHVLNHSLFKSLLFFGAGAVLTATGERDMEQLGGLIHRMPHDRLRVPGRLRRDLGAAAAQRLRLRMADLPGDPAQPATAAVGPEVPGAGGRRAAGAVGGARRRLLRQGLRHHLPRPAAHASGRGARTRSTASRSRAMFVLAALCLVAGILPGLVIDALAPVDQRHGRRAACRCRPASPWLSIVPIAESRSSYNGLLRLRLHRGVGDARGRRHPPASPPTRLRRAPAWDCGYPDAEPGDAIHRRQLRAADPPRVRHAACSARASSVEMPPPGDIAAGALHGRAARSGLGRALRADRRRASSCVADRLNRLQFLTIRRYLSLVFARPGRSAAGARDMAVILDLAVQGAQMLLVLLLAPLLTGFVRKVKARLLRRQGPPLLQPYRDLLRLLRKEVVLADNASWLFRVTPYLIFAATWVAAALVPTFAHRPAVHLVGRPHRHHRAARQRALLPGARRHGRRHQLRRHRLEPRDDDRLARRAGDDA